MRSWTSPRTGPESESGMGPAKNQAVPRSIRRTASRPQLRAMSVALDDQGEIVPSRGTTRREGPVPGPADGPYSSRRARTALSRSRSGRSVSTKCQCSEAVTRRERWISARRELSFSSRNAETAVQPRSLRINDMKRAGKARLYRNASASQDPASVAPAELGVHQRAAQVHRRARLHARRAQVDLHPPREVLLRIHLELAGAAQQARRHPDVAHEQPVGVCGKAPA